MQLYLLGTFLLRQDAKTLHLPRRKVEALLAYLALYPQEHTRDQLAALFWGDASDELARTSLRTALGVLRKHLGANILLTERGSVQLNPEFGLWTDTRELERAARAVRAGHALSDAELDAACSLYRGDLLTEFYEDWVPPLREHYRQNYLDVQLHRMHQLRSAGEYARMLPLAETVLACDPGNERAFQHLMFCQIALGDRHAALQTYARCVEALENELGVEPSPETVALYDWITQTAPARTLSAARLTNLPLPLSSFVGRQREMATLKHFLERERLVTLTGAGGSGKTRLAIQTGIDLLDTFPDGVWWIELASVQEGAQVLSAATKALGIRETPEHSLLELLLKWLGARRLLLIFDNCEHVIEASAHLAEKILNACAGVKILVTSRESLHLTGEQVWNVPTLAVPEGNAVTLPEQLLASEAVRLFVERARVVKPDFVLTEQNAFSVMKICQRLDGIPLALELAAARVNVLSPDELAARLSDRFTLLTSGQRTVLPRQQTLRALIDWSYDLLSQPERKLFWRLGVFSGGRTLTAIEAVCADDGIAKSEILDLLARLVSKSLLYTNEKNGETRYSFLDSIKQYAREKLRDSGESDNVKNRHLAYFQQLTAQAEVALAGPQQADWMRRLELDHYNLRNALEWADTTGQTEAAFSIAAALWRFWKVHGHYAEGRAWYARLLDERRKPVNASPHARAAVLYAAGMLAYHQSDTASAERFYTQSLAIQRELQDESGIARALSGMGLVRRAHGDYGAARIYFEQALELAYRHGETEIIASCLRYLGLVAVAQGDAARAVTYYQQALPVHQALGDEEALANLYNNLGIALTYLGEMERAQEWNQASYEIRRRLDDLHGMALSLHTLSYYARERSDWAGSLDLLQQALRLYQRVGTKENTFECFESIAFCDMHLHQLHRASLLYSATDHLRIVSQIPRSVPSENEFHSEIEQMRALYPDFETAWAEGQTMTLEQAVAVALQGGK